MNLCLQNISFSCVYTTSLLTATIDYSMNTKQCCVHNPSHKYRVIFQNIFLPLHPMTHDKGGASHPGKYLFTRTIRCIWVPYLSLCTSVTLNQLQTDRVRCFHNQRQLYLTRKLRSITEVTADDTSNLIPGLAFLRGGGGGHSIARTDVRYTSPPWKCLNRCTAH